MNFKAYLQESYGDGPVVPRSKPITEQEAVSLLKTHCKDAYKYFLNHSGASILYRGLAEPKAEYFWIDPKSRIRTSKEGMDYYQIIMETLPVWKDFPPRRTALICSNHEDRITYYGHPFAVFPYDGAKFGIAPDDDIWTSFKGIEEYGCDLTAWDGFMKFLLSKFFKWAEIANRTDKPEVFVQLLHKIDAAYAELGRDRFGEFLYGKDAMLNHIAGSLVVFLMNYNGNMWEYFAKLFDPAKNNFKMAKGIDQLELYMNKTHEVWTDSPAVLIRVEFADFFYNDGKGIILPSNHKY